MMVHTQYTTSKIDTKEGINCYGSNGPTNLEVPVVLDSYIILFIT